ncbi:MAG TPA: EsaB/YukD family protein, partial [Mycobacterium sp.]|nr:EsaB/YukD family protein [Mycobacterium sp.]
MTLPPSLSDLDPESESEHELSRLTLVVGDLNIDVGLPANVRIAEYIHDVIDIANEQIAVRDPSSDIRCDDSEGKWTLAQLGGEPIDPHRSLNEVGIYDGDLLMLREVGRPVSPLLFDDVNDALADGKPVQGWLSREAAALTCFGVGLTATTTLAAVLPRWAGDTVLPAAVLALGVVGVVSACAVAFRPAAAAHCSWVAAV